MDGLPYTEQLHVPYTKSASTYLDGDLYIPNTPGLHPVVLLIHGGGWVWGYNDDWAVAWMAPRLAGAGYAVFNINYRWARRGGGFPRSIEDVKNAWAWLIVHRKMYHLNSNKITLVGLSAGAYLGLMAAYTAKGSLFPATAYRKVRLHSNGVIAFYPPTNLHEVRLIAGWWAFGVAKTYMHRWLAAHKGRGYAYASPITYAATGIRTYVLQGIVDIIVPFWQANELYHALKMHQVSVSVHFCAYASHAFMPEFIHQKR